MFGFIRHSHVYHTGDHAACYTRASIRQHGFPDMLRLLGSVDAVHALYYTVMYPWVAVFGISELSTRTPSAIALGLMAAILTRVGMIFGWRITGSPQLSVQVGVTTAVIMATLPGLTWAGQESRGYAMAMLAVVVALLYFDRFLRLLRTRDLVLFALAQAFAVGFSTYTLMLVPLYVLAAWMWQRLGVLRVGVAGAVITVSALPLLVLGASQSEQVMWVAGVAIDVIILDVVVAGRHSELI